jgi:hypothetical protein
MLLEIQENKKKFDGNQVQKFAHK